jgi:hypothetical protein
MILETERKSNKKEVFRFGEDKQGFHPLRIAVEREANVI